MPKGDTLTFDPAQVFNSYDPVPASGIERAAEIMRSGRMFRYSVGRDASEAALLERDIAAYVGVRYALGVSSCSSALLLSLVALGVEPGDKVLLPGFTFTAVPSAVVISRAVPVFVECTRDYRMDVDDFRRKITSDTKVLLLSHMRGHLSDMDAIVELCNKHGVAMVEDAAHALGERWRGKQAGSFGKTGCFSFQSNKIANGGEGGMLVTDEEELMAKAIVLSGAYEGNRRKHFISSPLLDTYGHQLPLHNVRMTNLTAAIVRPQIPLIAEKAKRYRKMYSYLERALTAGNRIAFPQGHPHEERIPDSIQFRIEGFTPDQMRAFIKKVNEAGVPLVAFGVGDDNARHFDNWKYVGERPNLPQTREALANACDMRLSSNLEEKHLAYLVEVIRDAVRQVGVQ